MTMTMTQSLFRHVYTVISSNETQVLYARGQTTSDIPLLPIASNKIMVVKYVVVKARHEYIYYIQYNIRQIKPFDPLYGSVFRNSLDLNQIMDI